MRNRQYPPEGNVERARSILGYIAAVAGTPIPRRVREPREFSIFIQSQERKQA